MSNVRPDPILAFAVAKVTFEKGKFIHESISTFFTDAGAIKTNCEILGITCELSEESEECFDDYC